MTAMWIVTGVIFVVTGLPLAAIVALGVRILRQEIREQRFAKLQQDIHREID